MDALQQAAAAMEDGALDTQKLVRLLLESALNAIMDERADMACEGGANSHNGYRERGLITPAGEITLRIPKLRCGMYFPDGILERNSRVDKAVAAAVAELRSREFSILMPYLFLDATYVKCRRDNRVQSTAVVTAIAVGADDVRRVVGLSAIDTETYAGWLGFYCDLRKRGVSGVRCVTSDAHEGLRRALAECFLGAAWQRCIAHLERNVCSPSSRSASARPPAGSCRRCSPNSGRPRCAPAYYAAIDAIAGFSEEATESLEEAEADALAYLDFLVGHCRRILTCVKISDTEARGIRRP